MLLLYTVSSAAVTVVTVAGSLFWGIRGYEPPDNLRLPVRGVVAEQVDTWGFRLWTLLAPHDFVDLAAFQVYHFPIRTIIEEWVNKPALAVKRVAIRKLAIMTSRARATTLTRTGGCAATCPASCSSCACTWTRWRTASTCGGSGL